MVHNYDQSAYIVAMILSAFGGKGIQPDTIHPMRSRSEDKVLWLDKKEALDFCKRAFVTGGK